MVESQVRQVTNDILARVGEPTISVPLTNEWLREWIGQSFSVFRSSPRIGAYLRDGICQV